MSTRSGGRRPSSALFDIDEDNVSVHMDSPLEVERTLSSLCVDSPQIVDARARAVTLSSSKPQRKHKTGKKPRAKSVSSEVYHRRTIQGMDEDSDLPQQQESEDLGPSINSQGHVNFNTSLYNQAIANGKLDAPHSWLAFRIQYQLLATYDWYEGSDLPPTGAVTQGGAFGSTRSNASADCGYQDVDMLPFQGSFISSGFTQSTTSFPTGITAAGSDAGEPSFWDGSERESFADPVAEAEADAMAPKASAALYILDLESSPGVLASLARTDLFRGNLWLARILVALVMTTFWSLASTLVFPLLPFPVTSTPSDLNSAPYFFWLANLAASLCAVSCPTWPLALSLMIQKTAFQVLLQNAFNCPLAAIERCDVPPPLTSLQTFVLGVMALLALRAFTARNPADLVVSLTLDLLGYAYISGALGLLVSMVDPSDASASWATIWLGMLSVMWMAQFAGYCCDAIMFRFQLPHVRVLPPRVVVTLDVEASFCAITAGSLVLVFGGQVLGVPGGVLPKVLFSIASVLMARFGRLIVSLLKKAAGVRWSGRLMPGFGGVLDGSHALLFTSIVFVKYYLYVMARENNAASTSSSGDDASLASSVTFSSVLAG
ncbi:hypothetical protein BBJ28_00019954 [Nothophytophthora sp. Chile5]|nr:hypothetical protein BBJ28_00019954 [Nothophytophthora sp. Chile5]